MLDQQKIKKLKSVHQQTSINYAADPAQTDSGTQNFESIIGRVTGRSELIESIDWFTQIVHV